MTQPTKEELEHELAAQGETATPEQLEAIAKHRAAVAEALAKDPIPEEWLGRTPQEEAERDLQIEQLREENQTLSKRVIEMHEALQETQELVRKLAHARGGYDRVAAEVVAMDALKERRRLYQQIIAAGDRCTITIHTHPDPAQNFPVRVSVNGIVWELARGVPHIVPACVVEVLDQAKVGHWTKVVGEDGNPRHERHEYLVYPYTLVDTGRVSLGRVAA